MSLQFHHNKMASVLRFHTRFSKFQDEIVQRSYLAEFFKRKHFIAARKIQVIQNKI